MNVFAGQKSVRFRVSAYNDMSLFDRMILRKLKFLLLFIRKRHVLAQQHV